MKNLRAMSTYQENPRSRMGAGTQPNIRNVPAVNPDETFFHFDIVRALEMHRGLALGIFLTALVLCSTYLVRRWHTFKADSIVYVQPAPQKLLQTGQEQQWPFDANTYETYIEQQIHNVTRADVLAAAVERIPNFQGAKESLQAAADRLGGNLEVNRVSTGYQIAITATAGSSEEAAQMANAVADSFIQSATKEQRSGDSQRLELLREERDRVEKELASDRTEQDTLNRQLGVASVGATPDFYDDQISAIRAELVKARTDNDEAAARLMATAGGGPSSAALDAAADEIVAADPGLVSMKTALNKRRSDLISQMSNLKPDHPLYKQDAEELAKIQSSLDAMTKELRAKAGAQIEQRLKSDLDRTSSVEARLNGQLAQMTRTAGSATPRLQRANDLATDIARLQARFAAVDEQYRNLSLEVASPGAVYVAAPAMPPLHANRKKVYRNALIVLLGGIVFALAGVLIALNLDPRIYISADVERVLGFAPMALLPDLYEVGTGVAEEYMLRLAAAVEHAHQQGNLHSCLFTGVAAGVGVTTVTTRVTSMLQAMGRDTVLVDTVGEPPEEPANPGSGLVHVPRGSRSTALLQQMTAGAPDEAVVVTDAAPLLVSGETEYLARFVDSAIIVIESGVTTKAQLREVSRTLERLDVAAVGFVLNRISLTKANPAFRESVRAVEKHLRAQARTFDRQRIPTAPPAKDAILETPERQSPIFERLQGAVSEPSYPIEAPLPGATRAGDPALQKSQFREPLRREEFPPAPETKEKPGAANPGETQDWNAKRFAPVDSSGISHNSATTETATMWQKEDSAPTAATPVWHSENSMPAFAAPTWTAENSSPVTPMESSAPAEEQRLNAAEISLEEVPMEERRVETPLQSVWWETAAAPSAETAAAPLAATSEQFAENMPERFAEAESAPNAVYALTGFCESDRPVTPEFEYSAQAASQNRADDRELPSSLHRPLENMSEFTYTDFLMDSLKGVSRWEDGFVRLRELMANGLPDSPREPETAFAASETPMECSATAQALSPEYAGSDYSTAASDFTTAPAGQDPMPPAVASEEMAERQMEGWRFGPSNSVPPARGRDAVQVILGGPPSAPLTGEGVPDVWRDLLRAEEEAAYAAQQAQGLWPPVSFETKDNYAVQRPAEEFYVPPAPPEPIYEAEQPADAAPRFGADAEATNIMQLPSEAQHMIQSSADATDFSHTEVEVAHPFESDAEATNVMQSPVEAQYPIHPIAEATEFKQTEVEADHSIGFEAEATSFMQSQAENSHAEPEPEESLYREQARDDTDPGPVEPSWTKIEEVSSHHVNPIAMLSERGLQPEPMKEWWDELTASAGKIDEPELQAEAANTPALPPATEPDSNVGPQIGEQDEGLYRAASRLGGLRNLLFSLGIPNQLQGADQRKAEAMNETRFERPQERPVYAQPSGPNGGPNGVSAEVTAPPQIIPPRFNPQASAVREKEPKTPVKPPPVNRWDSPDDVDILPSRRGQYRQRY